MKDRTDLPKRLLVLDIGNTSVTGGLYHRGRVTHVHRIAETRNRTMAASDTLVDLSKRHELIDCVISSVVPELVKPWSRMAKSWTGRQPILVTHKTPMPVGVTFPKAGTIGADRLANACGAYSRYGAPCIVIDIGTALTFDIVKPDLGYIGGVIGPGLPLMFDYMAEKTALLPQITPMKLKRSVGKSTEEAMRIGAQLGYRGMVREILKEVKRELGVRRINVVATGGYAKWVIPDLDNSIPMDDDLTLYGLGTIYDYSADDN
ncbi:MAG: type III pantothenate kinase [Woeseiaceae bacterium]